MIFIAFTKFLPVVVDHHDVNSPLPIDPKDQDKVCGMIFIIS